MQEEAILAEVLVLYHGYEGARRAEDVAPPRQRLSGWPQAAKQQISGERTSKHLKSIS